MCKSKFSTISVIIILDFCISIIRVNIWITWTVLITCSDRASIWIIRWCPTWPITSILTSTFITLIWIVALSLYFIYYAIFPSISCEPSTTYTIILISILSIIPTWCSVCWILKSFCITSFRFIFVCTCITWIWHIDILR